MSRNCCNSRTSLAPEFNNNAAVLFKVLIIGDSGVGKSSLLQRFVEDVFRKAYAATIGVDLKIKEMNLRNKFVKLQIWDTAGHEQFRSLTSAFYRGAHGAVLVYDVTKTDTFTNVDNWLSELGEYGCSHTVKILFGNKCDMSSSRAVSRDMAFKFADSKNMSFFETSAKTGDQVSEAFRNLVSRMLEYFDDGSLSKATYPRNNSVTLCAQTVENVVKPCSC